MTSTSKYFETLVILLLSLQLPVATVYGSRPNFRDIVATEQDAIGNIDETIDIRRARSAAPTLDDKIFRDTKFSKQYRESGSIRIRLFVHCYGVSIRAMFNDDCDDLSNFTKGAAASWFLPEYKHLVTLVSIVDRTRSMKENEQHGVDVHFFDDNDDHELSGHRSLPSYVIAHANENFVHVNMPLVLKYDTKDRRRQLKRILTHEFGHCFGLRDTSDPASIMSHVNLLYHQSQRDYRAISTLFETPSEYEISRPKLHDDRYPWYLLFA